MYCIELDVTNQNTPFSSSFLIFMMTSLVRPSSRPKCPASVPERFISYIPSPSDPTYIFPSSISHTVRNVAFSMPSASPALVATMPFLIMPSPSFVPTSIASSDAKYTHLTSLLGRPSDFVYDFIVPSGNKQTSPRSCENVHTHTFSPSYATHLTLASPIYSVRSFFTGCLFSSSTCSPVSVAM